MIAPSHQDAARVLYPVDLLSKTVFYSTIIANLVVGILTLMGKLPPSVGATCLLIPLCVSIVDRIVGQCLKPYYFSMGDFFKTLPEQTHPTDVGCQPTAKELTSWSRISQVYLVSTVALALIAVLVFTRRWNPEVLRKMTSYSLIAGVTVSLIINATIQLLCKNSMAAFYKFMALRHEPMRT